MCKTERVKEEELGKKNKEKEVVNMGRQFFSFPFFSFFFAFFARSGVKGGGKTRGFYHFGCIFLCFDSSLVVFRGRTARLLYL